MKATINGLSMNFQVSGPEAAPPVVLHHPLATNLSIWDALTAALEPHYRVVRLDARGHGHTTVPEGAYDFSTLTADTLGLMDHLGIDKARYLGLSMGGFVGQMLALENAQRFHCLSLVSTSSDMTGGREIWDQRISTASSAGMTQDLIAVSMSRWLAEPTRNARPELVSYLSNMVAQTPPQGFVGWCHAIRDFNVTDRLKQVRVPVQVIVGALDPATTPAMAQVIHREIAGSEYAEVPAAAHMLNVEQPDAFHALVLPFFAKHGPAA